MSELQAALEIQVELSKFYNVDLFQRGYYQVRTSLKTNPKAPVKAEVSLPKNSECSLVFPASIINGVAVSKTFQILYRNEDISINDIVVFKVYMLVDSHRIEASIEDADFVIDLELWFSDEEFGAESQNKLQCISSRSLRLHFTPTQGLHHHIPVLFDYFHLSVVCVTIHATLLALHQPYINLSNKQPKSAWASKAEQSTMESVLFGANNLPSGVRLSPRTHQACSMHRKLCHILLCAYESLQLSLQSLLNKLPSSKAPKTEFMNCHAKLDELALRVQKKLACAEDELFQTIQFDIAQLCAQNVILWSHYLDLVTLNERVTFIYAQQHHTQRVKRLAEGFYTCDHPKQQILDCFDNSVHGHSDMVTVVRNSRYLHTLPPLPVECAALDGETSTIPIVFEDIFLDASSPHKVFSSSELNISTEQSKSTEKHKRKSSRKSTIDRTDSSKSTTSEAGSTSSSSPRFKHSSKLKFIKNMRPETIKRPSSVLNPEVAAQVAMDPTSCELVGYRRVQQSTLKPVVELGTLSPTANQNIQPGPTKDALFNAVSMPTLLVKGHVKMVNSGSLPDLSTDALNELSDTLEKFRATARNSAASLPGMPSWQVVEKNNCDLSNDSIKVNPKDATVTENVGEVKVNEESKVVTADDVEVRLKEDEGDQGDRVRSLSESTSSAEDNGLAVENGYLPSSGYSENSSDCEALNGRRSPIIQALVGQSVMTAALLREPTETDSGCDKGEATVEAADQTSQEDEEFSECQSTLEGETSTPDKTDTDNPEAKVDGELFKGSADSGLASCQTSLTEDAKPSTNETYMSEKCTVLELLKEEYKGESNGSVPPAPIKTSASTPELSALTRTLVAPVPDKTINFIAAKEALRKQVHYPGHLYSDYPQQASSVPYFWPPEHISVRPQDEGIHLIVCVHGLDGNSADLRLVKTYLELALPGERIEFLMSERNQQDTFADFDVMTDRLVGEINYHLEMYGFTPSRLSFVGHSLGNLIIRSALTRTELAPLLPKLYTFLSLSGPHLGTLYNNSGLVNMGMWFMQKWKKSGSLLQLSLKDHPDPRQTFLYKLSQKTGLEFFRNVLLVGSQQDRYVPYHSSRIELCKQALRDTSPLGSVYAEMVSNILQPIIYSSDVTFIRYDVFHALPSNANSMIGRAAHIAVLDSELFIEKFFTVAGLKYFK